MVKITVKIEGLKCPMCEAHAVECIKKNFKVKSAVASHKEGEAVIEAAESIDGEALKTEIEKMGYQVVDITEETVAKKGFFASLFGKK